MESLTRAGLPAVRKTLRTREGGWHGEEGRGRGRGGARRSSLGRFTRLGDGDAAASPHGGKEIKKINGERGIS